MRRARAEEYAKEAERKWEEDKSRIVREVWKDDFAVEKALEGDSRSFNKGRLNVLIGILENEFVIWYVSLEKRISGDNRCVELTYWGKRVVWFKLLMWKKWITGPEKDGGCIEWP